VAPRSEKAPNGICLLLRDQDPEMYERAALPWHGRICREAKLSMAEADLALAALQALVTTAAPAPAQTLIAICEERGLRQEPEVLDGWLSR